MKFGKNFLKFIITGIILAFCLACGSSDNDANPQVLTGQFIDAKVCGIHYKTATQEGMTNENGEFLYIAGETVEFSIGEIRFPAAPAGKILTPCDLAGTDDTSDMLVVNIARLLQTLDTDGKPENGITIGSEAHAATAALTITIKFDSITFDADVADLVANGGSINITLIDASEAIEHLEESIASIADDYDTSLPDLKFTTDWLNGRTLYNVFYEEDTWKLIVMSYTDSGSQGYLDSNPGDIHSNTYSITPEGYITFINEYNQQTYIKALEQTEDRICIFWGQDANSDTYNEFFYFDYEEAKDFIDSAPAFDIPEAPECFLVHFENDQYWQEMVVEDPNQLISSIDISGDGVTTEIMTYGLYPESPTEWWSNPNIFISDGVEPTYPLHHTMVIHYKDGTSETFDFTTTTFEEAE